MIHYTLPGFPGQGAGAAWSPDGAGFVTAGGELAARVWDAASGQLRTILVGHSHVLYGAAWSPDSTAIVTASADRTARVWDAAHGQTRALLPGHRAALLSAAWSPDGTRIVTALGAALPAGRRDGARRAGHA